ncbi:MAG: hypothetical protein AMXMBFR33_28740 [Candidatus Xenobia bacterium]
MLRLATWNVHNLLHGPHEERKVMEVARGVSALQADLVALEEVEDQALLEQVALKAGYETALLVEGHDPRGIDVALLSRVPLRGYRVHDDPLWARPCLEVQVESPLPLVLLCNHFTSRLRQGHRFDQRRREQAERVLKLVGELGDRPVAVLGDLNDEPDSWALRPLFQRLHDPLSGQSERHTFHHRGRTMALDHILLNQPLADCLLNARVARGPEFSTSDHSPVVAELGHPKGHPGRRPESSMDVR